MKTKSLETIWTAKAKIQRIAEATKECPVAHWVTLAVCVDTPNEILRVARELQKNGHDWTSLWVKGDVTDRKMVGDLYGHP